jgi:16S rRNA (guanine527-N7)-methyltransferase
LTDLNELGEKHFLDTLPLIPFIPPGSRVLDIGSGGGFPGVPLKVMRPDLHVDLIEASRKKAHFLKHLIRTLALQDIEAFHVRAEEFAKKNHEARLYGVIVSKAVSKLPRLLDLALPLLQRPGMVIAMKGISVEDELERARPGIKREALSVEKTGYRMPFLDIKRNLIILRTT